MFGPTLKMANYRNSMVRMGFAAYLDAGADHVSAYILTASGDVDDEYRKALRALADALPLAQAQH
jgi:hypothetical protein